MWRVSLYSGLTVEKSPFFHNSSILLFMENRLLRLQQFSFPSHSLSVYDKPKQQALIPYAGLIYQGNLRCLAARNGVRRSPRREGAGRARLQLDGKLPAAPYHFIYRLHFRINDLVTFFTLLFTLRPEIVSKQPVNSNNPPRHSDGFKTWLVL